MKISSQKPQEIQKPQEAPKPQEPAKVASSTTSAAEKTSGYQVQTTANPAVTGSTSLSKEAQLAQTTKAKTAQAATIAQAQAEGGGPGTYTVRFGDTLHSIAQRHGSTWQDVARANGITNPNRIYPGQVLQIPGAAATSPTLPAPSTAPTPPTPPAQPTTPATYTVQPGDTLSSIAQKNGTTWQELARINGISNPDRIEVGQQIRLPGGSTQPTTPTNPTTPANPTAPAPQGPIDANAIHINQFSGDPNGSNADCGPTSLAMALHGQGLAAPGDQHSTDVQTIQATRQAMYPNNTALDGVTVNSDGSVTRNDAEHSNWSDMDAIKRGAEAAGATTETLARTPEAIAAAIQNGSSVVVNGNPGRDGGGWASYNDGHFINVSGYNPQTNTFTINDPLDQGPREITADQLKNYMSGVSWGGAAMAIKNPNASTTPTTPTTPANPTTPTAPTTPTNPTTPATPATYTVRPGDTLSSIAQRNGTTWQELARINGITNPDRIEVGQQIRLPASSNPVTGPAPVTGPTGPTTGGISSQQLRAIMPTLSQAKAEQMLPHINAAMAEAGINTPQRQAAFLAQIAHESGELKWMEELASGAAYEGRTDLGNTQPGDGVRFKGRGFIQLTGRDNYARAGRDLGLDLINNPGLASTPENAARVAAWFWNQKGLNSYADQGQFDSITYRVNGGYNGKASRDAYYAEALRVLGA